MSTKLYHAFSLAIEPTLDAIEAWATPLRQRLRLLAETQLNRWTIQRAVMLYDAATLAGDVPKACMAQALRDLWAGQREAEHQRQADVDMGVSVMLYTHLGQVHGLWFIENPVLRHAFLADPAVTATPYQNASDERYGCDEATWAAREALWDRLLGHRGVPALAGVNVTLTLNDHLGQLPTEAMVAAHQPSLQDRAHHHGKNQALEEAFLAIQAGGEPLTMRRVMRVMADAPLMATLIQTQQAVVAAQLKAPLTLDDLTA